MKFHLIIMKGLLELKLIKISLKELKKNQQYHLMCFLK